MAGGGPVGDERALQSHLRANPDEAGAWHMLGVIAEHRGAAGEAESHFRQAVSLAPAHIDARLALVRLLSKSGRVDNSLAMADAVLARDETHYEALSLKAGILMQHRRLDDADAAFRALTRYHPQDQRGWVNHGHLLKILGRAGDAVAAYRRSIDVSPTYGVAWWSLANLKPIRLEAADVAEMRRALAAAANDDDRIHLHFALGKALGDLGEHKAAFGHLRDGNALRLAHAPHDAVGTSRIIRQTEALFTPAFLAARAGAGYAAPDAIFIVGMPRSGSTLVEQILASHPMIEGTEELHVLNHVVRGIAPAKRYGNYTDHIAALPVARLHELGKRYVQETRRHRRTGRPFFTDKMPSNWIHTGLIRLILPNARIIDVRRHPMACGFANYAQHYSRGNNFSYDLRAIGQFYADYVRHMAHFDRVAPGFVHRVHHEMLVDDPEGEIRRLLNYLGLPFDLACLRFHETARAVYTPSAEQVRRPITRDGLNYWRAYEPWLDPLKESLGPVLSDYPAPPPDPPSRPG